MFKRLLPSFLLLLSTATAIQAQQKTAYDQLVYVNQEWKNQTDIDPALMQKKALRVNEQQLIQFHLAETEKLLRRRKVSNLSPQRLHNRMQNLNVLHSYKEAGQFPVNTMHTGRQPYFIDDNNTYCAVGYLMKMSGAEILAKDIKRSQNFNYLADIQHPDLMNWVASSGLSFDELALIQPGYPGEWPCAIMEMHYNNTGPDVNEYIEIHQSTAGLSGEPPFSSVLFYDEMGTLYKTLAIGQLQSINGGQAFYYLFPANENFADKGTIVLKAGGGYSNRTISETVYTDTSIHEKFFIGYPDYTNYLEKHHSIGENETTDVNTSLTYCGTYFYGNCGLCGAFVNNTWTLQHLPATPGTVNPCTIMPVGLSGFDYAINKSSVELIWQTASESNNNYFEIERSSDGTNFTAIGKVKGAGNSTDVRNYSFTDKEPQYLNHYRLKQVDFDGKSAYSKILFVKFANANPITITENPVKSMLQLQVNVNQPGVGSIIVYDFYGRTIKVLPAKTGNQNVDVSKLAAGKYLIRLTTTDGQVYSSQFVKQ